MPESQSMTRITKLYARALANPRGLSFREFERLLEAFGFTLDRTEGSHRQYAHPKVPRPLPVQPSAKNAKPYQVRQFLVMIQNYDLDIPA